MKKLNKLFRLTKTILALSLVAVLSLSSTVVVNAASLGIDVSKYQGGINWTAVAGDGVDFAMLRLGYRGYS